MAEPDPLLSPMVGYAATALGYLAVRDDVPVQVREVAAATGVPAAYLSKIVHRLSRLGILRTKRGIGGGVELAVDPQRFTLYELCAALEDRLIEPRCLIGSGECCDEDACPAHDFSQRMRSQEIGFLKRMTILEMGEFDARRRARGRSCRTASGKPPGAGRPTRGRNSDERGAP